MARSFANVGRSARQSSSLPSSLSATALLPQVRYTPRPSPSASSWRSTAVKPPLAVTLSSPRVEHQQLLKQKLAAQSFRCVESTLGKVSHEKLRGLALDDHDEPCQFQVKDEPFGELEGCVRDHQGELVTWPWLQQTEGQIWSVPAARGQHPLDKMIEMGLDHASADRKRGRLHSGVRAWFGYMEDECNLSAHRPLDPLAPLAIKLQEEWLFMRFACALIDERHVSVATVKNYCSAVQGWHAREHGVKLAAGLKLERLPAMLKGLRRVFGDPEVKVRRGLAPQALRRAMDMLLDPSYPPHANIRAALAVAFQGLLRSAEFCIKDSAVFNPRLHLTRKDLKKLEKEYAVIMITPCKNMKQLGGKTSPLVLGAGGTYIDAIHELNNLLIVDPTPPGREATTPLFRDPNTNQPLRYTPILTIIRSLMSAIGENPDEFGTHSLRIGGATSLFAAGADETVIRTMGRWSSDIHRLYVRACFERCCDWSRKAGSTVVTDVARIFDEDDDEE
jgi:hypothetical protein